MRRSWHVRMKTLVGLILIGTMTGSSITHRYLEALMILAPKRTEDLTRFLSQKHKPSRDWLKPRSLSFKEYSSFMPMETYLLIHLAQMAMIILDYWLSSQLKPEYIEKYGRIIIYLMETLKEMQWKQYHTPCQEMQLIGCLVNKASLQRHLNLGQIIPRLKTSLYLIDQPY